MKLIKVCTSLIAVITVLSVMFSACNASQNEATTTHEYSYTPSEASTSGGVAADPQQPLVINTSWQKNYSVTYDYFNPEQSSEIVTIRETRNATAFTAEYLNSGAILYYKQNGTKTDSYTIVPEQDEQVHSVIDSSFSELSSTFMKLSKLSANLPTLSNVLYMYDESVAGRNCRKYIQRAYSGGELTESVYVWVDAEFGFAAKCEAYDASDKLTAMWEVKLFSAGTIANNAVSVDLSKYNIAED